MKYKYLQGDVKEPILTSFYLFSVINSIGMFKKRKIYFPRQIQL